MKSCTAGYKPTSATSIGKGPRNRKPRRRRRMLTGVSRQRRAANARERRRIQGVNNAFVELKNHIPVVKPEDVSKIDTLRLAAKWIAYLTTLLIQDDHKNNNKQCHANHKSLPKQIQDRLMELLDFEVEDFEIVDSCKESEYNFSSDISNPGSCGYSDSEDIANTDSPVFDQYDSLDRVLEDCSDESVSDEAENRLLLQQTTTFPNYQFAGRDCSFSNSSCSQSFQQCSLSHRTHSQPMVNNGYYSQHTNHHSQPNAFSLQGGYIYVHI